MLNRNRSLNLSEQAYAGSLVGVHVGDSIGAPYETWSPKKIADDIADKGKLTFFNYPNPWAKDENGALLPAGRPTDDSDQTADLCYSLLHCNGIDPKHLRDSLRNSVYGNVSRLWPGKATGAGGTTRDTLSEDRERVKKGLANTIGTNGSLMRCAPMGLWLAGQSADVHDIRDNSKLRDQVFAMSQVSHAHQHCLDACWEYTKILISLLRGQDNWMYEGCYGCSSPLRTRIDSRLLDPHDRPYDPGAWPARGAAEFSLYVALYALKNANSFAEGIEMAVRVGGDTDTYGAIAGGLLGAKYGYDGIPKEWRDAILGHDRMVLYAKQIYQATVPVTC